MPIEQTRRRPHLTLLVVVLIGHKTPAGNVDVDVGIDADVSSGSGSGSQANASAGRVSCRYVQGTGTRTHTRAVTTTDTHTHTHTHRERVSERERGWRAARAQVKKNSLTSRRREFIFNYLNIYFSLPLSPPRTLSLSDFRFLFVLVYLFFFYFFVFMLLANVSSAAAEFGLLGLVLNFMYAFLFILFTTRRRLFLPVYFALFFVLFFLFGIYLISFAAASLDESPWGPLTLFTWPGPNK